MASEPKEDVVQEQKWVGFPRINVISALPMDEDGEVMKDKTGKALSAGMYYHQGLDVYAKSFKFRPLKYMLSYVKYENPAAGKFNLLSHSMYVNAKAGFYAAGILDSAGGERCGRPLPAVLNALSKEEQGKVRKQIPVFLNLFGVAYFEGEEPVLTEIRVSGKRIVQLGNALDEIVSSETKVNWKQAGETFEREIPKHLLEFTLTKVMIETKEKDKDGNPKMKAALTPQGNPMFEIAAKSIEYPMPIKEVGEYMTAVNKFLREENEKVVKSHREAKGEAQLAEEIMEEESETLAALDDEMPF